MLSILSLTYNRPELTISCMESLWKYYRKEFESGEFEYIVMDNDSPDGAYEVMKKEFKKYKNVHVYESGHNGGFGFGYNRAVEKAKGDYIVLLNNDSYLEDNSLSSMYEYLVNNPDIGLLGGKIKNENGTLQVSTGKFYTLWSVLEYQLGMQRLDGFQKTADTIHPVDWLKGAFLMMKKETYQKIGGFDEKIFMYEEDVDFNYRAMKLGFSRIYYPQAHIVHRDYGSSNRTFAIVNIYKNLPYLFKKHYSLPEYIVVRMLLKTKAAILIGVGRILGNKYLYQTYEKAFWMA